MGRDEIMGGSEGKSLRSFVQLVRLPEIRSVYFSRNIGLFTTYRIMSCIRYPLDFSLTPSRFNDRVRCEKGCGRSHRS